MYTKQEMETINALEEYAVANTTYRISCDFCNIRTDSYETIFEAAAEALMLGFDIIDSEELKCGGCIQDDINLG